MLHLGLDLSRRRIDVCVLDDAGELVTTTSCPPDVDGLRVLAERFAGVGVRAVVESMTGARFVHDTLEAHGWWVEIADAQKVKAIAPLAAKTDQIDARVLAELSWRDLIPAIWLPDTQIRSMRELGRFRLHLVKHRTALKNRIHATLITHGRWIPLSDLFGTAGRQALAELELPQAWAQTTAVTLEVIDHLDTQIGECVQLMRPAAQQHPDTALLATLPGVGDILGFTIASEIGDVTRFPTATKLVGYTGLCPRVHQSGDTDRRGPLTKHGPRWLRWAYVEAAIWAARHPAYQPRHQRLTQRLGPHRGPKVARIDTARRLATASWWMLTKREPFTPPAPTLPLAA